MRYILYFILIPALLPVFFILRYIYSLDRVEREPLGFVLKILILGAVYSLPCAGVEHFMENVIKNSFNVETLKYAWIENTIGVALVEEFSKWLVFMLFVWKNKNFDYRYDGIVYAVAASLGFAGLENILYVVTYGTGVSIGRAIFAIPGHTTFAVFMGYFLSRAKSAELRNNSFSEGFCKLLSLVIPMLIHGCYDFLLSPQVAEAGFQFIFYIFVIVLDYFAYKIIKHEFYTDRIL